MRPDAYDRGSAGAKATIVFLIVAAVLAGALWGTDRYVHARVESAVATQLQGQLGTPDVPSVEIAGAPFLTQVATRSLDRVHLVADQVGTTNDAQLAIAHVDMNLTDVTTDDWWKTMTVGRAEGTALVDYASLQRVAGVPLTYAGDGRFEVNSSTSVYGVDVKAKVSGTLDLDESDQTVALADPKVEVAGVTLPEIAAKALINAIVKPIPLTGVPFDLKVTSVEARDDGLHAGLLGENIPITR